MFLLRRGQKNRERFAHRGTVKRTPGACRCRHAKRVRTLHYIQIKDVLAVQDFQQMGDEILDRIILFANGEIRTKAELLGQNDFIPWKRGISL
jgi:altronate dehydratase